MEDWWEFAGKWELQGPACLQPTCLTKRWYTSDIFSFIGSFWVWIHFYRPYDTLTSLLGCWFWVKCGQNVQLHPKQGHTPALARVSAGEDWEGVTCMWWDWATHYVQFNKKYTPGIDYIIDGLQNLVQPKVDKPLLIRASISHDTTRIYAWNRNQGPVHSINVSLCAISSLKWV